MREFPRGQATIAPREEAFDDPGSGMDGKADLNGLLAHDLDDDPGRVRHAFGDIDPVGEHPRDEWPPVDLLPRIIPPGATASVVLTLWLSMNAALGLTLRPPRSRSNITKWWLRISLVPSSRNRVNQRYAVWCGGKCSGSTRNGQPPRRSTKKIAFINSRIGQHRRWQVSAGGGSKQTPHPTSIAQTFGGHKP